MHRAEPESPAQQLHPEQSQSNAPNAPLEIHISGPRYLELLDELARAAADLPLKPDAVIGIKRSGLFPAVYLSQVMHLPMFSDYEAQRFPWPRLSRPLIVDTVAWSGASIRRALRQLSAAGVPQAQVLVMYTRCEPAPGLEECAPMVDRIRYLYQAHCIPHFWYMRKRRRHGQEKQEGTP
ncbi:phosphoribosyltransferase [bacterium]|nr:phosphoribosyltransferase [bacterium]